jgi:hypothetical protein
VPAHVLNKWTQRADYELDTTKFPGSGVPGARHPRSTTFPHPSPSPFTLRLTPRPPQPQPQPTAAVGTRLNGWSPSRPLSQSPCIRTHLRCTSIPSTTSPCAVCGTLRGRGCATSSSSSARASRPRHINHNSFLRQVFQPLRLWWCRLLLPSAGPQLWGPRTWWQVKLIVPGTSI